jgi:hypothetical protein
MAKYLMDKIHICHFAPEAIPYPKTIPQKYHPGLCKQKMLSYVPNNGT